VQCYFRHGRDNALAKMRAEEAHLERKVTNARVSIKDSRLQRSIISSLLPDWASKVEK
jgi:hypothetical protein